MPLWHVHRQNAVLLIAVDDEIRQHRNARDFVLSLPHELERALASDSRSAVAKRERIGERLNDVGPGGLGLLEVRTLMRIRFPLAAAQELNCELATCASCPPKPRISVDGV